jgi:lipid II:glycine glycyltransferase (peptidoglycan interpeptide bridge formation enzyme)
MNISILETNSPQWRELLADIKHDIYQLPEYVALEGMRTNTIPKGFLAIDHEKTFFVPYLIRSCQDVLNLETEIFDVISPYGYSGIILNENAKKDSIFCNLALKNFYEHLKIQHICSSFFRLHPILNENFQNIFIPNTFTNQGETISINLALTEEQIWSDTKAKHRNRIRRCTNNLNLKAKIVKFSQDISVFCELYTETMSRVIAQDIYYSFNTEYFQKMDYFLGDYLYLCIVESPSGAVASAGLYSVCNGIVQALFGGISNNFVAQSPSILEIDAVRWWAKEQGCQYLHLGGGVGGSEDGVYQFKAKFSRQRHSFLTLRAICDQSKYDYLVDLKAQAAHIPISKLKNSSFFPAYRSF